jgi:hypothetical protein
MNWLDYLPLKTNTVGDVEAIAKTSSQLSTAQERLFLERLEPKPISRA